MPNATRSEATTATPPASDRQRPPPGAANDQRFPAWQLPGNEPQRSRGYEIAPVLNAEQRRIASMLVRHRFAWRGYNTDALANRADEPDRLTLAAWLDDELVATLTLTRDTPGGFHNEALYAAEIDRLRRPGRVLCEVSRLAVDPDFSCPRLLRELFASAFAHGTTRFAASDVVIGVNPRHVGYYQRRLGFRQIGARRHCQRVDAPVVLLHQTVGGIDALAAAFTA